VPKPFHIRQRLAFRDAYEIFHRRWTNEIYHKTYVEQIDDDTYSIRFRGADIILIHRNGHYTLFEGDKSDKVIARFNAYTPAVVCKTNGVWSLLNGAPFRDGMKVNAAGEPLERPGPATR
jgi:hypothetical protein